MNEDTQPHGGQTSTRLHARFPIDMQSLFVVIKRLMFRSDQIRSDFHMLPFFILFPFAMPCLTRAIEESDQIARLCEMFVAPVSSWCRTLLPSTSEVFTWVHDCRDNITSSQGAARTPGEALRLRRQRSLSSQQAPWRWSWNGRYRESSTGSLNEHQRTSTNINEHQRTSTNVNERQRTSTNVK